MIVVLTALDLEYDAVRAHLSDLKPHLTPAGTLFEVGAVTGNRSCEVAIGLVGKGNNSAATLTERAIVEFGPAAVFFVGIAGALRDWLRIGDVVVATKVYGYHGGRVNDAGFNARPKAWEAPHHIEQLARHTRRKGDWWPSENGERPEVHFEPVAAGEVVLDKRDSDLGEMLRAHFNDAVAIEMESAGVAGAGHLNNATPTFTVRGISDAANGDKDRTKRDGSQVRAATSAAAFAIALVADLDDQGDRRVAAAPMRHVTSVKNVASGNHRFVLQTGVVHGGVHVNQDMPAGRPDEVADLRTALLAARRAGRLDGELFPLVMREFDGFAARPGEVARLHALADLVAGQADLRRRVDRLIRERE
ncbi:5'-methylthioadenosine/S-adenosylhomocysteine nucleosidase family protein [Lentzea sp. NPDC055074]